MPCSFCKFAGHNVTTCQSTVLLDTFNTTVNKVLFLKSKPNTNPNYSSNADIFKYHISGMDLSMLKGMAGKLGISISGRNMNVLGALITRKMYFKDMMPNNYMNDRIYYRFLTDIIENSTHNPLIRYIECMNSYEALIKEQTRQYNIERLINSVPYYDRIIRENLEEELYTMLTFIRSSPNGIQRWFGSLITLENILEHIPNLRPFLIRGYADDMLDRLFESMFNEPEEGEIFEDVILPQSLDLTCEYVKKEIAHEDAKGDSDDGKTNTIEEECIICYSGATCDTVLNCGHTYCIECVITTVKMTLNDHRKKLSCPMCRADMKHVKTTNEEEVHNLAYLLR